MTWIKTLSHWTLCIAVSTALVGCGGSSTARRGDQGASTSPQGDSPAEEEAAQEELKRREVVAIEIKYVPDVTETAQNIFQEGLILVYEAPANATAEELAEQYKLAAAKFQDAISEDGGFIEAYFNLGMMYERLKDTGQALEIYRKAAERSKARELELRNSGQQAEDETVRATKNAATAEAYMAKILLRNAQDMRTLGNDYDAHKNTDEAKKMLDKVLLRDENNVAGNNAMALYWLAENNLEQAEESVKSVLNIEPMNTAALNTRGLINLRNKEYRIAKWIFLQKVIQIDKNSTEAWTNLGMTYLALGDKPRAVDAFDRAATLDPDNVPARLNLAAIYLDYLNYPAARDLYAKVLLLDDDNVEAMIGRGTANWGLGAVEQTVADYERCLELTEKYPDLLKRLGGIYEGQAKNDKAIAYYERYIVAANVPPTDALVMKVAVLKDPNFGMEEPKGMDGDDGFGDFEDMDEEGDSAEETPSSDAPAEEAPAEEAPAEEAPAEEAPAEETAPAGDAPAEAAAPAGEGDAAAEEAAATE